MKLTALNAVITGGSQGLGRAIAENYLREGANIVICARSAADLDVATRELRALAAPGQIVASRPCDVSSEADVESLRAFAAATLGEVHVVVANAGIYGPMGPTEEVDIAEWRRALDINLFGVLLPCRAWMPEFKRRGSGKFVVISGGGATNPMPNISAYASSKAAVVRLVECLAQELEPFDVQINAIAPGALRTRMMEEVLAAGPEKVGGKFFSQNQKWTEDGATPLHLGAELAVHLGSAESGNITGRLLSARWDPWRTLANRAEELAASDIYCLRRIVPEDRGKNWEPDAG